MTGDVVKRLARECGFELAGVAAAEPSADFPRYLDWVQQGYAGEMRYLSDRRAGVRADPKNLLASAKSIICVGKLYNTEGPAGPISRYAWGKDYHRVMRDGLERMVALLGPGEHKICVDTAPLLERSYARQAGLGWIGKNTCLIHEPLGSWFFLGEILTSLEIAPDSPPPDRCGTCTRCIDACPTQAIVPKGRGWTLDSRRCISYFTIELRGPIPEEHRAGVGEHVFGCDICQDVCPWNSGAPLAEEGSFRATATSDLGAMARLSIEEFQEAFADGPVARAKHSGFLRNVAVAMGNSGDERYRPALEELARSTDELVAEHARWALTRLR
ncbi:MAG TPA: tRNA epoxyqueuosine(34) reductase QueG [Bryobacteraceae bacterium]|nr:tRNA epoxyqueuosine(34) reductase QueG [Bryobacteraceae bacterium]